MRLVIILGRSHHGLLETFQTNMLRLCCTGRSCGWRFVIWYNEKSGTQTHIGRKAQSSRRLSYEGGRGGGGGGGAFVRLQELTQPERFYVTMSGCVALRLSIVNLRFDPGTWSSLGDWHGAETEERDRNWDASLLILTAISRRIQTHLVRLWQHRGSTLLRFVESLASTTIQCRGKLVAIQGLPNSRERPGFGCRALIIA